MDLRFIMIRKKDLDLVVGISFVEDRKDRIIRGQGVKQ